MSSSFPFAGDCALPCATPNSTAVPGQKGDDGDDGQDGTNAYTLVTEDFDIPAVGSQVTVNVGASVWLCHGAHVFVEGGFHATVYGNPPTATTIRLTNPGYSSNPAPGTTIVAGSQMVAAGNPGGDADSLMAFGTAEIPNGVSEYNLTGLDLADDPDQVLMTLRVPEGEDVITAAIEDGTITSDGWTILLSAATAATGYKVDWMAKLPAT